MMMATQSAVLRSAPAAQLMPQPPRAATAAIPSLNCRPVPIASVRPKAGYSSPPDQQVTVPPDAAYVDFVLQRQTPLADLSIVEVEPIQTVKGTKLVAGKRTAVRVKVSSDGISAVTGAKVKLVYNGREFSCFYPDKPANLSPLFELRNFQKNKPPKIMG